MRRPWVILAFFVSFTWMAEAVTEEAFNEEYAKNTHPCYLKWTMVFTPRENMMKKAYQ